METQIEQPLVISQNTQFAEKFLGTFKRLITNVSIFPENFKNEVTGVIREYIQESLQHLGVYSPDIDKLIPFLVKHIDSIHPIIAICRDVNEKFPESKGLKLVYEVETEDQSGAENVTLYVSVDQKTVDLNKKLKEIVNPYISYLIDSGILFTIQFDYHGNK